MLWVEETAVNLAFLDHQVDSAIQIWPMWQRIISRQTMWMIPNNMWFNIIKSPVFRAKDSLCGACNTSAINIKQKE